MEQLKVAVIGCGSRGYHHARVYSELPDVMLEAAVDSNPEKVQRVTEVFHCKGHSSTDKMLEETNIDAVSVYTPTSTHFEIK